MIVVWTGPAKQDLFEQMEYLGDRNLAFAENVFAAINRSTELLEQHPHIGRPGRWGNTREYVVPRYPYILAYRVHSEFIEILHLYHTRQDWPADP